MLCAKQKKRDKIDPRDMSFVSVGSSGQITHQAGQRSSPTMFCTDNKISKKILDTSQFTMITTCDAYHVGKGRRCFARTVQLKEMSLNRHDFQILGHVDAKHIKKGRDKRQRCSVYIERYVQTFMNHHNP